MPEHESANDTGADNGAGSIAVEVAYAEPETQFLESVKVPLGSTLADAIAASSLHSAFPKVEVDPGRVGIFGRKATLDEVLKDGDRVEVYRPLLADPKAVRRARAEAQKESGPGD